MNKNDLPKTLISYLTDNRTNRSKGITFIHGAKHEDFLSYQELYHESRCCLYNLQKAGLKKGNELLFQIEDNRQFIILFWACLMGKILPVPVTAGNREDYHLKVLNVWKSLSNPYIITDDVYFDRILKFLSFKNLDIEKNRMINKHLATHNMFNGSDFGTVHNSSAKGLAYIQFSSGSTGQPKGVLLTHDNVVTNTMDIIKRSKTESFDRILSWMPLTHDMGLICFHLCGVVAGVNQFLMPTHLFVRRPVLWIEKCHEHNISQLYSPNFGFHYFLSAYKQIETPSWDLTKIRIIYNGAETISYDICDKFLKELAPFGLKRLAMYPGYGLAEASVAVALPKIGDRLKQYRLLRSKLNIGEKIVETNDDQSVDFVETGVPLENCQLRICNEKNDVLQEGVIGEIQIKGRNVTSGYYNNAEATNNTFTKDGWLHTGDLGFLKNERLIITGRAKNIIIINGQNYYPQDIEKLIENNFEQFRYGKVVACGVRNAPVGGEHLLIFLQFKGKMEVFKKMASEIKVFILNQIGVLPHDIIPIRRIPRTTSGKIQNFVLVENYQRGDYDKFVNIINSRPTETEVTDFRKKSQVLQRLETIWSNSFPEIKISEKHNYFDFGTNSLMAVKFMHNIQRYMHIKITLKDIFNHPTLGRLSKFIEENKSKHQILPIPKTKPKSFYPLSDMQRKFWFLHYYDDSHTVLNLYTAIQFDADINLKALKKSFQRIIKEHEIFRSVFVEFDGVPAQKILKKDHVTFKIDYRDFSKKANAERHVKKFADQYVEKAFELSNWPLFKVALLKTGNFSYSFIFVIHHIITDGTSLGLLIDEVIKYYYNPSSKKIYGNNAVCQFNDFVSWQIGLTELPKHNAYWRKKFSKAQTVLNWPFVKPRKDIQSFRGKLMEIEFPSELSKKIIHFSHQNEVTIFHILCAATRVLLFKYTEQSNIVIGTDTDGRLHPELTKCMGPILNTLPLCLTINNEHSFKQIVKREKSNMLEAFDHLPFSLDELIQTIDQDKLSRNPLFDVLILFQNMDRSFNFERMFKGAKVKKVKLDLVTVLTDIEFEYFLNDNDLKVNVKFNKDLFSEEYIAKLAFDKQYLLNVLLNRSETPIKNISVVNSGNTSKIESFEKNSSKSPKPPDVFTAIEYRSRLSSNLNALIFEDKNFTYGQLMIEVNTTAVHLVNEYGLKEQDMVAILVQRDERMIILLLALLKINVTYLPIDRNYPTARIALILEDAQVKKLITDSSSIEASGLSNYDIIWVDDLFSSYKLHNEINNVGTNSTNQEDLAYVLYTSGTSGAPKGVMVRRESISNYVNTFNTYFNLSLKDKVIQQSSLSFDVSVEEIFPILASGGVLVVLKDGGKNIEDLFDNIVLHQATILSTTPLLIKELNQRPELLVSLRALISGGESLKPNYVYNLIGKINLFNTYGPTETTVCVTYQHIENIEQLKVIGTPLPNHQIKILDKNLLRVDVGVEGEIYIAGIGLALGYLNRPEETEERFIRDETSFGLKIYKTGDFGKWSSDGKIVFSGRKDDQIKWRGYRIEPGEIEKNMLACDKISHAFVCIKKREVETRLIGYFIAESILDPNDLLNQLCLKLPAYMVPSRLIQLQRFPMNVNGKIDIKALPFVEKADNSDDRPSLSSLNKMEKTILQIWQEVFSNKQINVLDNFFAIGGNSLNAAKIVSRIQRTLAIKPSFKQIFTNPTVSQLSRSLQQTKNKVELPVLKVTDQKLNYQLSFGQNRLWMLHNLLENKAAYNLTWTFELASLDLVPLFEKAMEILVERHESLRTVFPMEKDQPTQKILDNTQALRYVNKLKLDGNHNESSIPVIIAECAERHFDLENGPLLYVTLIEQEAQKAVVVIAMHHIIADGWSMEIFQSELRFIIDQLKANKNPRLEKLPVQYKDFAIWQLQNTNRREMEVHEKYWTQKFSGEISSLKPPYIDKKSIYSAQEGRTKRFPLPNDFISKLRLFSKKYDISLFMIVYSILNLLLFKISGLCDITLCAPVANRNHKYLESLIGYFLNLLPLRLKLDPEQTFEMLIYQAREVITEAYDHQDYPIDRLFGKLQNSSRSNAERLFDILIVMQDFDLGHRNQLELEGSEPIENLREVDNGTSISDLLFEFNQFSGDWELKIRYNTTLYDEEQINGFADRFVFLVNQILTNTHLQLQQYDIVLPQEKWLLPQFISGPKVRYIEKDIIALFDKQVAKTPGNVALSNNGKHYTYYQLSYLINQFANYISNQYNLSSPDRIGLDCMREEYTIVALFAILKVGATYVPIDPSYPPERKSFIIEDCGIRMVIVDGNYSALLSEHVLILNINQEISKITRYNAYPAFFENINPDQEAYVIYTSGSTGKPKGVRITHGALSDYVQTFKQHFQLNSADRVIQQSSLAFDVSVEEIFPALCSGATLLLYPHGAHNIDGLIDLVNRENATVLSTTPLVINELNRAGDVLKNLRILISGGDILKSSYIDQIPEKVSIFNTYGPTECTVCVSFHEIKTLDNADYIGKPIANHSIYLLDPYLVPVPPGIAGEIYVEGNGLSAGYVGLSGETNKRFKKISHISNETLYKTGDRAIWQADGSLKFLGRLDDQIKIQGYRVEPGETEAIISSNPLVNKVLVLPYYYTENMLIAYYTGDKSLTTSRLKNWTKQMVPRYMVPAIFCHLDNFPQTVNGKIDVRKLPPPVSLLKHRQEANGEPADAIESKLLLIWEQILGLKPDDVHTDFFSLGGNSIKATKLIGKVKMEFGVSIGLADIFKATTVKEQRHLIYGAKKPFGGKPVALPPQASYDVSNAQKRLWVLNQFEGESAAYNILLPLYIYGRLDIKRLEKCLMYLVRRHESLRTVFRMIDGKLQQIIQNSEQFQFSLYKQDLCGRQSKTHKVEDIVKKEQLRQFDLAKGPLFFCKLLILDDKKYLLIINQHHIISDGWSVNVLMNELSILYFGKSDLDGRSLEELTFQYKDFTAYLNRLIVSDQIKAAKKYWLHQFQGEIPKIDLPTDFNRPATKTVSGGSINRRLDVKMYSKLQKKCSDEDISFFVLLLASFNVLLYKYCNQSEFIVASPVSGRDYENLENQIGCYVNTLAFKTKIDGNNFISNFLKEVKKNVLQAFEYQIFPFDLLIENLPLEKDLSRSPLFDVILVLHQTPIVTKPQTGRSIHIEPGVFTNQTCKYDLILNVFDHPQEEVRLTLEYNTDLFLEQTAVRLLDHFIEVLKTIQKENGLRIDEIDFLSGVEKDQLIHEFNKPGIFRDGYLPVTSIFEKNVLNTPQAIAVSIDLKAYTYAQINNMANKIAHVLAEKFKVGTGNLVGLLARRTELMVASIIGIMKSGATYVPVDPDYPDSRINYIIKDCDIKLVITEQKFEEKIDSNIETVFFVLLNFYQVENTVTNLSNVPDKKQISHIIYTSGSTGLPKGVALTHHGLSTLIFWAASEFQNDDIDLIYAVTSLCFDLSLFEIFYPLCTGKTIRILKSALYIEEFLDRDKNVLVNTVPTVVTDLLERGVKLENVKTLNVAGEVIPRFIKEQLKEKNIKVRNLYGPSEDTTYSTCYLFKDEDGQTPIGKPIFGASVYILDDCKKLAPVGGVGQIGISGKGVAVGYVNRPVLTNQKFIRNPFKQGEILYLTGDLGKWRSDGVLLFQGRIDDQVKIRGYRIELGEIEYVVYGFQNVKEAVARICPIKGENQIVVFFTANLKINISDLKNHLSSCLPSYMIPQFLIQLSEFPLNSNGKIDKSQLKEISQEHLGQLIPIPQNNDIAKKLNSIWRNHADVRFGFEDSFFEVGGHSLKAIQLVNRINSDFSLNIRLKDIFLNPKFHQQVELIQKGRSIATEEITAIEEQSYYSASEAQTRLWVLSKLEPNNPAYNMSALYKIDGLLDLQAFRKAYSLLIQKHEILRTYFPSINQEPKQLILPAKEEFSFTYHELDSSGNDRLAQAYQLASAMTTKPFDLESGPPIRLSLFKILEKEFIFSLVLHHIISDGWSMEIILKEVISFYRCLTGEFQKAAGPLNYQYKDFSGWHRQMMESGKLEKSKQYWINQLRKPLPVIEIPSDLSRPAIKSNRGERLEYRIGKQAIDQIKYLASSNESSTFMILLSLLKILLYKYSGQNDIIVGIPIAGRKNTIFENQIGFYVNTIAIRTVISFEDSFLDLLLKVKTNILNGYEHQDYPFHKLVEVLDLPRDLSRSPVFDIMVSYQNQTNYYEKDLMLKEVDFKELMPNDTISKYDLNITFSEKTNAIDTIVEYNKDLFDSLRMERMMAHFLEILQSVHKNPNRSITSVSYLTLAEKNRFLKEFNRPYYNSKNEINIIRQFELQAEETPDRPAILCDEILISYKELNKLTNKVAWHLIQNFDLKHQPLVGILFDRSEYMIIAMLGILKAGGAYLPIDPVQPLVRIRHIVWDSNVGVILTTSELFNELNICRQITVPDILDRQKKDQNPMIKIGNDQLCYAIYTSGTTGKPKGVLVEHGSLNNLCKWLSDTIYSKHREPLRVLLNAPVSFDSSVKQIFPVLINGSTLVIVPEKIHKNPKALANGLDELKIDIFDSTPSQLSYLLRFVTKRKHQLKYTLIGGEVLHQKITEKYYQIFGSGCNLINLYGITETTVDSAFNTISMQNQRDTAIGKPIFNTEIYILDKDKNMVPLGVDGELFIGGDGISRGYLNQPDLTHDSFIYHEELGKKLYKSGDIGYWSDTGKIILAGRKDRQIKLRGYRIELGEIEKVLEDFDFVEQAIIVKMKDQIGDEVLVAYVKCPTPNVDVSILRSKLSHTLPDHMIPSHFVILEQFVLNDHGKIDVNALPDFTAAVTKKARQSDLPQNSLESDLIDIWEYILGKANISVNDNFFEIGGNSLKVVNLYQKIIDVFPSGIEIHEIFSNPTIRELAALIGNSQSKTNAGISDENEIKVIDF